MTDTQIIFAIIPIGISIIMAVMASAKNRRDIAEADTRLRERMTALEVKISLYWDAVTRDAAKILHTPHPENARRDYLLEQFVSQQITREELEELIKVLKNIIDEKARDMGERTAASNMLRALEQQYEI
jgi:hypothetical protein